MVSLRSRRRSPSPALLLPAVLVAAAALLVPPSPLGASEAGTRHRWTVDDLVRAERASDWDVSPDGAQAVWVRTTVEKVEGKERRVSNLWLSDLGSKKAPGEEVGEAEPRPLTRGRDRISQPVFSPDGRHVAFLSDRKPPGGAEGDGEDGNTGKRAETQLWVIPVGGGEAFAVTRLDRDVRGFGWTGAENLVMAAEESPTAWERERKRRKDDSVVVDDSERQPPVRLFTVTLGGSGGGNVRRLTHNTDWIDALEISSDGSRAVVTAQQSLSYEFDARVPPETYLVDLASGELTRLELTESVASGDGGRRLVPFQVRWALDGSGFYFADAFTRHPLYRNATVTRLHFYDLERHERQPVDLDWERGLGGEYWPTRDGFIALLADGVRYRPARYTRQGGGWHRADLTGTHAEHLDGWALSSDGATLVYEHSAAITPPQWFGARLAGDRIEGERRLTDLNPSFADKPTGRVEVIRWTGALGDEVEGLLHYPLDWREGERRPLILDIHGGPTGTDRDSWDQRWASPGILWRQRGAFILQANYHGSAGYGLDWAESIEKRYYELEIPDLEAGVDHVIALGLADPQRLATSGWSNGGILSAELITRSGRYKAASVGAADVEWISDWANVDFGASFDNYYFGGPPWEIPQVYIDKSPFFRLTEVTTPTIVYTGTEDRNVPPHQSWSLFRAMQQIGEAPVRLVLFPGEPHGLRQVPHQQRKLEEDLAWFDRYLFGTVSEKNEAVRDGSPLAALLARAEASRVGPVLGREVEGKLLPETVPFADLGPGLEIGRFEVTRAQWAAYDGSFEVAPGEEDLPRTGVSLGEARAYAAWLSEHTGETWRLPSEAEAKTLAQAAGTDGNTLDRWAGYPPNPEDRRRLLEAVAPLGKGALLTPAGRFAGTGEPAVFDLDGNVAEWAEAEGGGGQPAGPSADRPTDPRSTAEPEAAYVGLRVVRVR